MSSHIQGQRRGPRRVLNLPPCSAATARLRRPRSCVPPFTWRSRLPGELSGSEDSREPEPLFCWWSEAWEPVERSEDWLLALAGGGCAAGGGSAAACMQHACQCHAGTLALSLVVITRHAGGRLECQRVQVCETELKDCPTLIEWKACAGPAPGHHNNVGTAALPHWNLAPAVRRCCQGRCW